MLHRLATWLPALVLLLAGFVMGWLEGNAHGKKMASLETKHETATTAIIQKDSSVVLERQSVESAPKAPHIMPKGSVEERRITVQVQPKPIHIEHDYHDSAEIARLQASDDRPQAKDTSDTLDYSCPPVNVVLSLVRMQDNTHHVVASSPDGNITGGLDMVIESSEPKTDTVRLERPWSISLIGAADKEAVRPGIALEHRWRWFQAMGAIAIGTDLKAPIAIIGTGVAF